MAEQYPQKGWSQLSMHVKCYDANGGSSAENHRGGSMNSYILGPISIHNLSLPGSKSVCSGSIFGCFKLPACFFAVLLRRLHIPLPLPNDELSAKCCCLSDRTCVVEFVLILRGPCSPYGSFCGLGRRDARDQGTGRTGIELC